MVPNLLARTSSVWCRSLLSPSARSPLTFVCSGLTRPFRTNGDSSLVEDREPDYTDPFYLLHPTSTPPRLWTFSVHPKPLYTFLYPKKVERRILRPSSREVSISMPRLTVSIRPSSISLVGTQGCRTDTTSTIPGLTLLHNLDSSGYWTSQNNTLYRPYLPSPEL